MSQRPSAADRKNRDWVRFVSLSGETGQQWLEIYSRTELIEERSTEALNLMRQRQPEAGLEILREVEQLLQELDATTPASVRHIHKRWFHGVEGFYYYCTGQLDLAEDGMMQAHRAVASALGEADFLLPFAYHCHEFRLHRARIARNRRRWDEMVEHIAVARQMVDGSREFCRLDDGTPIQLSSLKTYYQDLPDEDKAKPSLAPLYDDGLRLQLFDQFVGKLCMLPGFVIPYRSPSPVAGTAG